MSTCLTGKCAKSSFNSDEGKFFGHLLSPLIFPLFGTTILAVCKKSARRIKKDAQRWRSKQGSALLLLQIITSFPSSAFSGLQRVCCKRSTEKKHHSLAIYRTRPPRLIFSLPPYPTAIPLYVFWGYIFLLIKHLIRLRAGSWESCGRLLMVDMGRLHRFSAVIQASCSSDSLSKPRSEMIAFGIKETPIGSQSLRSPPSHLMEMTILLCFLVPGKQWNAN